MILETAQLLCTQFHTQGLKAPYRPTHKNHPCSLWLKGRENFEWALALGEALCAEFLFRRGKPHKSQTIIEWCVAHKDKLTFSFAQSAPPLCMPNEFKIGGAVESYRAYYKGAKQTDKLGRRMDVWTPRNIPDWYVM